MQQQQIRQTTSFLSFRITHGVKIKYPSSILSITGLKRKHVTHPGGSGCGLSHVVVLVLWSTQYVLPWGSFLCSQLSDRNHYAYIRKSFDLLEKKLLNPVIKRNIWKWMVLNWKYIFLCIKKGDLCSNLFFDFFLIFSKSTYRLGSNLIYSRKL